MNLKGNLTSKGLQGSIGKSRMQGILGTNPAAIPITVDNALSLSSTNPVQNRVITAAITNRLWSDEVKDALLQIVEKVAYVDDQGQTYYDALYDALYPPVGLDSIGAVFDSSATIYNTDTLDDLKQYLTVTAYYTSGDSEVVTTYTLSGSMDAGTQTITVSYGGKATTFTVTVVEWLVSISAVFTQGSAVIYDTDSLDTLKQYLTVTATYADSSTAVVSDYTLSGTLTAGTSTITVSYGGKTDTFTVSNVEHLDYAWDASSGVAPKDKDGNDIPGSFVDGLYKLTTGGGEYAFANNAPIYCIIEFAAITKNDQYLIPMFAFCHNYDSGGGDGFKFYNSNTGKIATSTSGSTVTTTTDFPSGTQIQTLTATASANGCSVDLDGLSYSGAGVVNNAYLLTTSIGVGNGTGIVADIRIKSIKFRYLEA